MARHYVPRTAPKGLPDSPEGLGQLLANPATFGKLYPRHAGAPSAFYVAYMQAFAARDQGETAGQLREQAGDQWSVLQRLQPYSSARAALFRADAPGAGSTAAYSGLGEFARDVAAVGRPGGQRTERLSALQNSFSTNVPADGGFLVPEEWRSELVLASLESSVIRPRAIVVPAAEQVLHLPITDDVSHASSVLGGVVAAWVDEGVALTESQAKFGDLALDSKKVAAYSTAANELVADAPAFQAFIREVWPTAIGWAEDQGFISGTGAGEPLGIINSGCAISVTRATGGAVKFADVIAMLTRLLPQSFPRAVWFASPDVLTQLLSTHLVVGAPATESLPPTSWLQGDPVTGWTLLGRPLFITEHVPALGSAGDLTLCDPTFYVIADRLIMQLRTSEHVNFNVDKTALRLISRLDGRMWPQAAVTPRNASATVSPVVKLV